MSKKLDLVGTRFGRLVVVEIESVSRKGRTVWRSLCDCGNFKITSSCNLTSGRTRSCGCLAKESSAANGKSCRSLDRIAASVNGLYSSLRCSARVRSLEWSISIEDFYEFIFQNCFYCGGAPSNTRKGYDGEFAFNYSGLDRVNNDLGYTQENIVPCCSTCNRSKGVSTVDEFLSWVDRVKSHQELLNG